MQTISEIMTQGVHTLTGDSTLRDAEILMRDHHVRHIPVLSDDHTITGVLSQKEFLREAFRITDKFGAHHLQDYLAKTAVAECIERGVSTLSPDAPLKVAGEKLQAEKQGCLLIADEGGKLLGIVTSQDFVRLALDLLR